MYNFFYFVFRFMVYKLLIILFVKLMIGIWIYLVLIIFVIIRNILVVGIIIFVWLVFRLNFFMCCLRVRIFNLLYSFCKEVIGKCDCFLFFLLVR